MKKKIVWAVLTTLAIVVAARAIYLLVEVKNEREKQVILPRACLPFSDQTLVCYTCLKRNMSSHFMMGPIHITSSQPFNFISFKDYTNFTCDEFLQMVDSNRLLNSGLFRIQNLNVIYETLLELKGSANRIPQSSAIINEEHSQLFMVQKILAQNRENSYLRAKTLNQQMLRQMILLGKYMSAFSIAAVILIELGRKYSDLKFDWFSIPRFFISFLFFLQVRGNPFNTLNSYTNISVTILFLISLQRSNIWHFIPAFLFLIIVKQPTWTIFTYFFILLFSLYESCQQKQRDGRTVFALLVLLLWIVNHIFLNLSTQPWEVIFNTILKWIFELFSPSAYSLLLLLPSKEPLSRSSSVVLRGGEDEMIFLKNQNE